MPYSKAAELPLPPDAIRILIAAARRRQFLVELFGELAIVLAVGFACLTGLLLLGTDILQPAVLPFLLVIALVACAFRLRRRLVSEYQLAQIVDRRLHLTDTLSTAWYLLQQSVHTGAQQYQLAQAVSAAQHVQLPQALPFRTGRTWQLTAALATVTVGVLLARYFVQHSLDLRLPLVHLSLPAILTPAAGETPRNASAPHVANDPASPAARDNAAPNHRPQPRPEPVDAPAPIAAPNARNNSGGQSSGQGANQIAGNSPSQNAPANGKAADTSSSSSAGSGTQSGSSPNATNPVSRTGDQSDASRQSGANASPNLMQRMTEALQNMMATASSQSGTHRPAAPGNRQNQPDKDQPGKAGQGNAPSGEQSASQPGSSGEQGGQTTESNTGDGDGQASSKPGAAQGHSSNNSGAASNDSQSGVGSQDGSKELRDAEQQQAMGKLAEILSKRSASLEGDMTMETPSGRQQLQTQYSGQRSAHADTGVTIHRNEIPLRFQPYVRRYMEQARRSAAEQARRSATSQGRP